MILRHSFFAQDALYEKPATSRHESVDVVVVADPHQGVAFVGEADSSGHFRQDGHGSMKRDYQEIGRPRLSKVAGRSPRAFRACSRACLAISMRSRQSGSIPDGGDTAGRWSELVKAVSFRGRGLVMIGLHGSKRE
ncbi:MAG: hypothetical protein OXH49_08395 [Gemmatimonadetes bacterium]|nr:hypothetical protein [Gemmatimonadota bacterium]